MGKMDDPWNFHQCKLCSYKSRFLHCMLRHVRLHKTRAKSHRFACDLHSPDNYRCQKCDFQSDLKILLKKHFDSVHRAKETQHHPTPLLRSCKHCDFQTNSSLVLLRHDSCNHRSGLPEKNSSESGKRKLHLNQLIHTNEKKNGFFHCSLCSYKTTSGKSLTFHVIGKHTRRRRKHSDQQTSAHQKKKGFFHCNYCSFKTKYDNSLKTHVIEKHTPADQIDYCTLKAKTKGTLRNHMLSMHSQLTKMNETLRGQNMKAHITLCKKKKCEHCSFKTKYESDLAKHLLALHPETVEPKVMLKQFKCDHCTYKTMLKEPLEEHLRNMHSPSGAIYFLKCEICSFKASTKWNMAQHIFDLHPEAVGLKKLKVFKCDHCSYETTTKQLLEEHLRNKHTPSGEIYWLKCDLCSFKANEKWDMSQHVLARHPETVRPKKLKQPKHFKCKHCSYETTEKEHLEKHIRILHFALESQSNEFNCEHCPFRTKNKGCLSRHMLKLHPKNTEPNELKYFKSDQRSHEVKNDVALKKHTPSDEIKSRECDSYSYEIIRRQGLKLYLRRKHTSSEQINSLKCLLCSYKSNRKDNLGRHILVEHMESENAQVFYEGVLISGKHTPSEQIYCVKCILCTYKSKKKNDLGRHILTQHMETKKAQVFHKGVLISS